MSGDNFHSVLVTGANRGIGMELVKQFLGQPKPPKWVLATCRDPQGERAQVRVGNSGLVVVFKEVTIADTNRVLGAGPRGMVFKNCLALLTK